MQRLYDTIVDHHDARFVVLAILVCLLASYTAFTMMARLYAHRSRYPWVIAAAVVTGCGSWATHSIMMLAYQPGVPVAYNVGMTVISGLIAVLGCGVGFYVARGTEQMALGGAIIGFAVGAMHFTGVAAVTFQAHVDWDILYFEAAVLAGASFGAAALARAQLTPDVRGRIVGGGAAHHRNFGNPFHRHGRALVRIRYEHRHSAGHARHRLVRDCVDRRGPPDCGPWHRQYADRSASAGNRSGEV